MTDRTRGRRALILAVAVAIVAALGAYTAASAAPPTKGHLHA